MTGEPVSKSNLEIFAPTRRLVELVVIGYIILFATNVAASTIVKEDTTVDALIAKRAYLSFATYVHDHPALLDQPRYVRLYTHVLTTQYTFAINFSIFTLKDLKPGEHAEDFRGKPGTYEFAGTGLDDLLYNQIKAHPDSPDINYAVGEYLSRGESCGCRHGPLRDLSGSATDYFTKAYRSGVYDDWSLFQLGVAQHSQGHFDTAIGYYIKALALNPNAVDPEYNLATAYFAKHDYKKAKLYVEKTLGRYKDSGLSADSYAMHGLILTALHDDTKAEQSFVEAQKLQRWQPEAFTGLLDLYRRKKERDKYIECAERYIALDYGNPYAFNQYVDYVQSRGSTHEDGRVEHDLLALKLTDAEKNGALYFNLARLADQRGDRVEALIRYRRSLSALKAASKRNDQAINVVTARIADLTTDMRKQKK